MLARESLKSKGSARSPIVATVAILNSNAPSQVHLSALYLLLSLARIGAADRQRHHQNCRLPETIRISLVKLTAWRPPGISSRGCRLSAMIRLLLQSLPYQPAYYCHVPQHLQAIAHDPNLGVW